MSLTSIDFLMCLGIYTYGELADNSEPSDYSERYRRELLTSVRGGARIWLSAVEGHRTTTLLPFGPWSRHPSRRCLEQGLSEPLIGVLSFALCLFYSLHIITLFIIYLTCLQVTVVIRELFVLVIDPKRGLTGLQVPNSV